ncbi:MAG: type IV secretion system DNA-binding domain-containing protein [Candidatus Roizmanbacteria bacterium]|nr:type IV secretion system DNA-binding domain-containing protein [Candidatus Roizmanbacteria bacterium]
MKNINWSDVIPPTLTQLILIGTNISWVTVLLFATLFFFIGLIVIKYVQFKKSLQGSYVLLEIKPPSISLQTAFTTKQLFTILHSFDSKPTLLDRLLKNKKRISYEIASSRNEGIRYLIYTSKEDVSIIRKNLLSYLPGIEIKETPDYLPNSIETLSNKKYSLSEFKFKNSYVLPLKEQGVLGEHDPIAYITGQMTKLEPSELISLQLVTSPITPTFHAHITDYLFRLQKRIYEGKEIVSYLQNTQLDNVLHLLQAGFLFIFNLLGTILKDLGKWVMDFTMASPKYPSKYILEQEKSTTDQIIELTPKQSQIQEVVESKINQDLFEVTMRLLVVGTSEKNIELRKKGIIGNFATYTNLSYQALKVKSTYFNSLFTKLNFLRLKYRLFSFTSNPIFSVSELSTIYHFPFTLTTQTEDLQSIKSSHLPAPLSLKNPTNLDIMFAHNIHGESITPIGLTLDERRRHMYLIGATGMGKTTLLLQMIYQDIKNGKGVAVMDPHGDLATRLIGVIPKDRIDDVVYFNPYDLEHPFGLNVLQMTKGLSDIEMEREKDLIVSSLISVFLKLYPSNTARPRMEHVLRNTILAILSTENPTLLTAYKMLVDKNLRDKIVSNLTDPLLKEFWEKEFKGFGSFQRAELISPITNKLGRFFTTKTTRNILTQEKSKLDFDDIMNNKKILICDLSKGKIGEDISSFLGSLLILKLQLAALNRVHISQEKREDFFLYIDEFQNFATMTFAQILSEARKYRLDTILAHQTISQIEDKDLLKVILANVGTVISYRTSNPTDEDFILPLFAPHVKEHQIANLPSFNFYIKINGVIPQDAFTGSTYDFTFPKDDKTKQLVIENSRAKYGADQETLKKLDEKLKIVEPAAKIQKSKHKKKDSSKQGESRRKSI